jgi:hypothetical protein
MTSARNVRSADIPQVTLAEPVLVAASARFRLRFTARDTHHPSEIIVGTHLAVLACIASVKPGGSMTRLDDFIRATPGLRAGAASDAAGQVIATTGESDFETLCATVALCRPQLESAVDMLALGALQVATFQHGDETVLARLDDDGADIFLGGAARNPDTMAQKLTGR